MTSALKDAPTGATEDTNIEGQDPDSGKLFEVPRIGIIVDDSDPTVLKIAFSGGLELDRANASDVEWYNRLRAGQPATLHVEAHVAARKEHIAATARATSTRSSRRRA
jgi:hypothetical protein